MGAGYSASPRQGTNLFTTSRFQPACQRFSYCKWQASVLKQTWGEKIHRLRGVLAPGERIFVHHEAAFHRLATGNGEGVLFCGCPSSQWGAWGSCSRHRHLHAEALTHLCTWSAAPMARPHHGGRQEAGWQPADTPGTAEAHPRVPPLPLPSWPTDQEGGQTRQELGPKTLELWLTQGRGSMLGSEGFVHHVSWAEQVTPKIYSHPEPQNMTYLEEGSLQTQLNKMAACWSSMGPDCNG